MRTKNSFIESLVANGYDQPLVAFIIGSVAGIAKALFTIVSKWLGLTVVDLVQVSCMILTRNQIHDDILGWLIVIIFGGLVGMVAYYSFYFIGRDYLIIKAIGVGVMVWFVDTSAVAPALGVPISLYKDFSGHLVFFSSGIIYGIVFGYLIKKFVFVNSRL